MGIKGGNRLKDIKERIKKETASFHKFNTTLFPFFKKRKPVLGGMPCSIYNHSCISLISIEEPYPGGKQAKIAIFNNPNKLSIMD